VVSYLKYRCDKGADNSGFTVIGYELGKDRDMENQRPLRVMHVIARMNVGGPAVLVADLMRSVDSGKFEQVLVTGYCDDNESDYLDEVATDIKAVRIVGLGRSVSVIKDFLAFTGLIREIKRFDPDVIHTHTAKAGVLGRIAGLMAKPSAKRVHTYHGHLLHGYFGAGKTRVVVVIEKILSWISHGLISIGTNVMNDLLKVGVGKTGKFHVIFPGLQDLDVIPKTQAQSALGLDPETLYVVFVGRLTQIKRPDRLVEIAAELKKHYPNAHLLVAGAGELFDATKTAAESQGLPMTFYGWRNDIARILCASDIGILCSDNEGIPLTLIQAAQAGLPIVSTDVGSVSNIVKHGISGTLVGCSSVELAQGLKALIQDQSLRDSYGVAGKKRANEHFSSRSMVVAHEQLYRHLLK
jgi:glycosyltransferase involved in cell wall biosynthesis